MMEKRRSKTVQWKLMLQLEEAGEEDICSLLNQLMGAQLYFGSGIDLAEYLGALAALERQRELQVRAYRIEDGRTVFGEVLRGDQTRPATAFEFDFAGKLWRWRDPVRQMVEVADD